MRRHLALLLTLLLLIPVAAESTGTLTPSVVFGALAAGRQNASLFDTVFNAYAAYINAREVTFDVASNRPVAGVHGRYFFSTDTRVFSCDDGSAWQTCASQAVLTNELTGMTTATVSQVNQITVAAGAAASDDTTITSRVLMTLASATQGNTAGVWTVGNFQNKLDAGALGASQTWHIYAIQRVDTSNTDILYSQSATAPTMPTNYTKKRRVAYFTTDAASNLRGYVQNDDDFWYGSPVLNVASVGTSVGATAFTASATCANGVRSRAWLHVRAENGTNNFMTYLSPLAVNDDAPSTTVAPLGNVMGVGAAATGATVGPVGIWTDTAMSYRIRLSAGGAADVIRVATVGCTYPRRP